MISKADFEDLFPAIFKPKQAASRTASTRQQEDRSISRWKDDGGRVAPPPPEPNALPAKPGSADHKQPSPAHVIAVLALMPTTATVGATAAMVGAWGRLA